MRDYSLQREEIETIKPRTITVNLSDADVRRLAEKSGEGGLTISELLENFIGDLVDGTYSNGSDERMYAEQWYQRCWFAMFSDDTFLKFLLLWGDLDDYIDLMDELESNKKEMEEMTADAEEYSAEERNEIQEYINDLQKEKDYYWNKFFCNRIDENRIQHAEGFIGSDNVEKLRKEQDELFERYNFKLFISAQAAVFSKAYFINGNTQDANNAGDLLHLLYLRSGDKYVSNDKIYKQIAEACPEFNLVTISNEKYLKELI